VWIRSLNVEYYVGVDGTSISMVLLTALVSFVAVLASFSVKVQLKGYWAMFLLLVTGMMGVFISLDLFLFYVFWEVMLLPMYFLIGIWGGPRKEYAAIKFFLYTLAGSVFMLLAFIAMYYTSGPSYLVDGSTIAHTFAMPELMRVDFLNLGQPILGMKFVKVVWVVLFIGFAIKVPMFPFHTWLPDAHVEAPTAISVILAGVLLKMGPRHGGLWGDQHPVRRVLRDGPGGPQAPGGLLVHQPHGVLLARHGVADAARDRGCHRPDVQPRHHHGHALLLGGRDLRSGSHP
jgi:NADH-quinone oxidoreductase subunit M